MHASKGVQLLEELRKTKWLPPYRDSSVRAIAGEIKELLEPFLEIMQNHRQDLQTNPSYTAGVIVFFRSIQRNKRIALAYLHNRLRRMIQYRWQVGTPAAALLHNSLSAHEQEFLQGYNKLLGGYCKSVKLDLTADLQPPRDLFVEVRVKRDCGDIVTDSGVVSFKQGTAHFLKRADVEHLIRQGALEHVV